MDYPEVANRRQSYRRTEDIYRKAIEELRDYAIFLMDTDGNVTNWNLGAEQILGYRESEILGKSASRFFTAEDRARKIPEQEMSTAAAVGRAEDERWHVRRDGSRFWASGVMTSVLDQSGRLAGFSKVMRDMTERNRLTEERDRFFTLSMDLLCIVHLDSRFLRVNPAFETALGFTESELLSMKLFDLVYPDDLIQTESAYRKLAAGEPTRSMENRLRCKDGGYRWFAWSYFPVPEDNLAFGVGRDTTEIRRIHEMLRLRADELENANQVKDEFLATLSHELRTPLTSILGWAHLLRSNKLTTIDQQRAVQIIQRNAESQSKLIEDLLDLSRIITGKLKVELQPVSFPDLVDSIVKSLRPAADAKSLIFETFVDPTAGPVSGDPSRLEQIISNVLSNAIKFTPEGGRVLVRLERSNANAVLEIKDTGVGIPAADLPHIFERFKQSDSSNIRAHSGLGLGLAIVDYLVRQHGGKVEAASEGVGEGATFVIEIPLASSEVITSGSQRLDLLSDEGHKLLEESDISRSYPQLRQLRILIVEDDDDTRDLLKTILEWCGSSVTALPSANEALREVERTPYDVLVSDIGMPGENGYELIKKIRTLEPERNGQILAIALTAYAGAVDRQLALQAGFQTHVAKPVKADEFLTVIATLADRHNAESS